MRDIREADRNTQGVKLIDLGEGDRLQAIAPVISKANEEAAENAPANGDASPPIAGPDAEPLNRSEKGFTPAKLPPRYD